MRVYLLESKRKPPEHPLYDVRAYPEDAGNKQHVGHSFQIWHRPTNKKIAVGTAYYEKPTRTLNVAGFYSMDSRVRKITQASVRHTLKHFQHQHPRIIKITANRISGANPRDDLEMNIRNPKTAQRARKKRDLFVPNRGDYGGYHGDVAGHHVVVQKSAGLPGHYYTHSTNSVKKKPWRVTRAAARALQQADPSAKFLHPHGPSIRLSKPKGGVVYGGDDNFYHPRFGHVAKLVSSRTSSRHTEPNVLKLKAPTPEHSKRLLRALADVKQPENKAKWFGDKKRLYRAVRNSIKKAAPASPFYRRTSRGTLKPLLGAKS